MHTRLILRVLVRASKIITLCLLWASKFSPASETTLRLPCASTFIPLLCNGLWPFDVRLHSSLVIANTTSGNKEIFFAPPRSADGDAERRWWCASSPTAWLRGGVGAHSATNHAIRTCLSWSFCILKDHVLAICYRSSPSIFPTFVSLSFKCRGWIPSWFHQTQKIGTNELIDALTNTII